jgi:hypothetical protein
MDGSRRFNPEEEQPFEGIVILGIEQPTRISLLGVVTAEAVARASEINKALCESIRMAKEGKIKPTNVMDAILIAAKLDATRRMVNHILARVN